MGNIGIIGAGELGATIAFFLAEQHIGFSYVYDDQQNIAVGKSLDLLEAAPIRKYDTYIAGTPEIENVLNKGVIILALGNTNTVEHDELTRAKLSIEAIKPHLDALKKTTAPIIVATEPYDVVTSYLGAVLPELKNRLLSAGSYIDSIRLAKEIAAHLSITSSDVSALVLGHHGGTLVVDEAFVSISGIPVSQVISSAEFNALAQKIRNYDHDFVELTKRSYPCYGPAAAFVSLTKSALKTAPQILPVSAALDDETIAIGKPHYLLCNQQTFHIEEKIIPYSQQVATLLETAKSEVEAIVKELI